MCPFFICSNMPTRLCFPFFSNFKKERFHFSISIFSKHHFLYLDFPFSDCHCFPNFQHVPIFMFSIVHFPQNSKHKKTNMFFQCVNFPLPKFQHCQLFHFSVFQFSKNPTNYVVHFSKFPFLPNLIFQVFTIVSMLFQCFSIALSMLTRTLGLINLRIKVY